MKQPYPYRTSLTLTALIAFLGGIALGEILDLPLVIPIALTGAGLLLALLGRRQIILLVFGIITLSSSLGFARFDISRYDNLPTTLAYYNDRETKVILTGTVSEDPDRRADHTKLTVAVDTLVLDDQQYDLTGNVLLKIARFPEYAYGDRLKITDKLETPFETEEFSYRDYLARQQIYSVMYYPKLEIVGENQGNFFWATLYNVRRAFETKLNQIFPEPQASFEAGLLIGSRRGIPDSVLADFNTTGLTHIIAISGYNVALVIAFVTGLFGTIVARRWQLPLVIVLVVLFTLIVGAGAPVVRAAIMGIIAFAALTSGRQHHIEITIAFTAVLMALHNPRVLTDISFQLSFAAVLGVLYVGPVLQHYLHRIPKKFAIQDSLVLTLAAQATAVPLIMLYFGRFSLIAPLANILVAPAIPLAMLIGFAAVLIGLAYLPAGILLGFVAYILLSYMLTVAQHLAKIPLASMEISWFVFSITIVYYLILGWLLWLWHSRQQQLKLT